MIVELDDGTVLDLRDLKDGPEPDGADYEEQRARDAHEAAEHDGAQCDCPQPVSLDKWPRMTEPPF